MIPLPNNDKVFPDAVTTLKGKYSSLHCVDYEYTTGKTTTDGRREFLEVKKDAAVVLIQNASRNRFLLLRQFRYPAYHAMQNIDDAWVYECVAGIVDEGYEPYQVAIKEAKEEAGIDLTPDQLNYFGAFWASPGISTERMHLFVATVPDSAVVENIGKTGLDHEGELLIAKWLTWQEVIELDQDVKDLKTDYLLGFAMLINKVEGFCGG
jgi:nudix-type nucleoside diphosphatase (YffH/AdpP family)